MLNFIHRFTYNYQDPDPKQGISLVFQIFDVFILVVNTPTLILRHQDIPFNKHYANAGKSDPDM